MRPRALEPGKWFTTGEKAGPKDRQAETLIILEPAVVQDDEKRKS